MRSLKITVTSALLVSLMGYFIVDFGMLTARAQSSLDQQRSSSASVQRNATLPTADPATLSLGKYDPYTLSDRFSLSAAMIANPSRLKTVGFASYYDIGKLDIDKLGAASLLEAAIEGKIAFVKNDPNSNYLFLSDKSDARVPGWPVDNTCKWAADSDNSTSTIEKCATQFKAWLDQKKLEGIGILAADPIYVAGEPDAKFINWSADRPFTNSLQTGKPHT